MRLAGTAKQYSTKAMPQLMRITLKSGLFMPPFKCQYQAIVMKMFESESSSKVCMRIY